MPSISNSRWLLIIIDTIESNDIAAIISTDWYFFHHRIFNVHRDIDTKYVTVINVFSPEDWIWLCWE